MSCVKKINKTFVVLLVVSLLCLACQSSAVMIGLSTSKLTKKSELIIMGQVKDVTSKWSADKKAIFTIATVDVDEVIKGRIFTKKIKVTYAGGEVGDIGMRVSDEVSLKVGERVLLFLRPEPNKTQGDAYKIFSKAQGKYIIGSDNIARKRGFSIASDEEVIDNNIPIGLLIDKIKEIENE